MTASTVATSPNIPSPCLTELFLLIFLLYLVLNKHGTVHFSQTLLLWSNLSKGHRSRGHAVCLDAMLQTCAMLPFLFAEKRLSPNMPSFFKCSFLSFDMLGEACRPQLYRSSCFFSEQCTVMGFPLPVNPRPVNNFPRCKIMISNCLIMAL